MIQETFVDFCLQKYKNEKLPRGQWWEDAHFPTPKCKGGSSLIRLWVSDHAKQGVLQSEDLGYPCIFSWERRWLDGWYLERFEHWLSIKNSLGGKAGGRKGGLIGGSKGGIISRDNGLGFFSLSREEKSEIGKVAGKITGSQKWVCLVTGKIMPPGPLASFQKRRGIDPKLRERLE